MLKNRKDIVQLAMGHFFVDFCQGALAAFLPILINLHHYNYAVAATLVFAMNAVSSVAQPLFGYLSDYHETNQIIIWGIALAGLGFGCLGIVNQYWELVTCVMVCGLGIAAYHPDAAKMVDGLATAKGKSMSIFSFGGNIGFASGPIILTLLIKACGIKGTLWLILLAGGIAVVLTQTMKKFTEIKVSQQQVKVDQNQKDDWFHFCILMVVLFSRSIVFYGFSTFLALYFIHIFHQSSLVGSIALSLLFIFGSLGTLLGGHLADKYGMVKVIRLAFLTLPVMILLFGMQHSLIVALILLIPLGLAIFMPYSPIVVLGQKYLPTKIGISSSITLGLAISVGGIATPILGNIADYHGLRFIIWILLGVSLIATVAALFLKKIEKNHEINC